MGNRGPDQGRFALMAKPQDPQPFPFAKLPKELRDFIWELAALDSAPVPRAHVVSVVGTRQDLGVRPADAMEGPSIQSEDSGSNDKGKAQDELPVAFLADGNSLWNTCYESREALTRVWKRIPRIPKVCDPEWPHEDEPERVVIGHPARWFNVHPVNDLLIIDKPDVNSSFTIMGSVFDHPLWKHDHPLNFAVAYDEAWYSELESWESLYCSYFHDKLTSLHWLAREIWALQRVWYPRDLYLFLWIIDYSLEPVAGMDFSKLLKTRPFFRANGRTYIEAYWPNDHHYFRRSSASRSATEFGRKLYHHFMTTK